jgi:hypothetical protein
MHVVRVVKIYRNAYSVVLTEGLTYVMYEYMK